MTFWGTVAAVLVAFGLAITALVVLGLIGDLVYWVRSLRHSHVRPPGTAKAAETAWRAVLDRDKSGDSSKDTMYGGGDDS